MTDDLYHDAIMAHAKAPHRAGTLDEPRRRVVVDNPLCGDRVTLDLRVADGRIVDLAHKVRGCALCSASASILADAAIGLDSAGLQAGEAAVRTMLAGDAEAPEGQFSAFSAFLPARRAKSRHDCVLLPFEAVREALA